MTGTFLKETFIYIVLISIFIVLVVLFIRMYIASVYEKRIKDFSLDAKEKEYVSLIDKVISFETSIMKGLSKVLKKSEVASKSSKKYEKYSFYNNNNITSLDYISIKIMTMLVIDILYIFTLSIKFIHFNIFAFIIVSFIAYIIPGIIYKVNYNNRRKSIENELLQAIVIMNSAFKSGKNINKAIDIVSKELKGPISNEFEVVNKDLKYGLSLEDAFNRFANRVNAEEAYYIAASLSLLSSTGGDIISVFKMIEDNFYNRMKIKNELATLTASSKLLYKMMCFLPPIFAVLVILMDRSYFLPLVTTELGLMITGIIIILYILYLIIIKKVMRVDKV